MTKKVGLISLGCDKNRVDSERALFKLKECGYIITNNIEEAQIIVINTCSFLNSSRKEAVETIIDCGRYKEKNCEKIIVTGCLPQKFISELSELHEVDAFLGVFDYDLIDEAIRRTYSENKQINYVNASIPLIEGWQTQGNMPCKPDEVAIRLNERQILPDNGRILSTPPHYAYLKIAEGCYNNCSYCLIPQIRGKYKSKTIEELTDEASKLGDLRELILVAQDVTSYGIDLYNGYKICELIEKLSALNNIQKIRLLYCYPSLISGELVNQFKTNNKLIKYIDIPFQHADNKILRLMNRRGNAEEYLQLIKKLKKEVKGIAIRSTFITGFPQEGESEFNNLCDFIKKAKLQNCGFFAYSREKDTKAYLFKPQVSAKTKNERVKTLYALQYENVINFYGKFLGEFLNVLCDGFDFKKGMFYGRAYFSAPDIDGKVYFTSIKPITIGEVYRVRIEKIKGYDLIGKR